MLVETYGGCYQALCLTYYELHQPYRGTTLTAENRLVNKHRVVEMKLASLITGDCFQLARLWLSLALLVVAETGASLAFRPLQQ